MNLLIPIRRFRRCRWVLRSRWNSRSWSSGGRAGAIPAVGRFYLSLAALAWFLPPLGAKICPHVDLTGAASMLGAGACWRLYLTGQRKQARNSCPLHGGGSSLIAAIIFVPIGAVQAGDALGGTGRFFLRLSGRRAFTALPLSTGNDCADALANPQPSSVMLMSTEPALAAVSDDFLGETLTGIQISSPCAAIRRLSCLLPQRRREPQLNKLT